MKFIERLKGSGRRLGWCCAVLVVLAALSTGATPSLDPVPPVIQRNYDNARRDYAAKPDDIQAACQLGRACFDRAEFARDSAERSKLANEGIAVCRRVVARQPQLAAGHYYLGLNLAQLARTKLLGALPIVTVMGSEWNMAAALDEKLDYAGPDRFVGLLYRDAPGWPVSLGDNAKARRHLTRAVELSPNFPENLLNLIETYLMWHETSAATRALEKLQAILPAARHQFTGEYWEPSWKDWNQRLNVIQTKLHPNTDGAPPAKP